MGLCHSGGRRDSLHLWFDGLFVVFQPENSLHQVQSGVREKGTGNGTDNRRHNQHHEQRPSGTDAVNIKKDRQPNEKTEHQSDDPTGYSFSDGVHKGPLRLGVVSAAAVNATRPGSSRADMTDKNLHDDNNGGVTPAWAASGIEQVLQLPPGIDAEFAVSVLDVHMDRVR